MGAPLLRLLAEVSGLRAGLSATLAQSGFVPGHDHGQVLIDVAVALGLEATSVTGVVRWHERRICGSLPNGDEVLAVVGMSLMDDLRNTATVRMPAWRTGFAARRTPA